MTTQEKQRDKAIENGKKQLDRRIEAVGWALFLILSGVLLMIPHGQAPDGAWLLGTGLIILGSMAIRHLYGIRIDGFWTILGILAIGFGLSEFFKTKLSFFPLMLIFGGIYIIYRAFFRPSGRNRNFRWPGCWRSREFTDRIRYNRDFRKFCWGDENEKKQ